MLKSLLTAKDAKRYRKLKNSKWLICPHQEDREHIPEEILKQDYPLTYTYLETNKE